MAGVFMQSVTEYRGGRDTLLLRFDIIYAGDEPGSHACTDSSLPDQFKPFRAQ
jgi:hypothetical protein